MKGINVRSGETVILSKEFFEREPVFTAASKFTEQYYVTIRPADEHSIEVSMHPKRGESIDENILKIFCNEVVEQQVRHDLQRRFGKLRDMIVEQAFYPLEKKNE